MNLKTRWRWVAHGWASWWRIPGAWHMLWPFRPVMCWMGRHDYWVEYLIDGGAMLRCFYCGHRNHQIHVSRRINKDAKSNH